MVKKGTRCVCEANPRKKGTEGEGEKSEETSTEDPKSVEEPTTEEKLDASPKKRELEVPERNEKEKKRKLSKSPPKEKSPSP